jgi:hypothetical protein
MTRFAWVLALARLVQAAFGGLLAYGSCRTGRDAERMRDAEHAAAVKDAQLEAAARAPVTRADLGDRLRRDDF